MELSLFFFKDKVLANGAHLINAEDLDSVREDLLSGILVIRRNTETSYTISTNKYYESELCKILERSDRNVNTRAYKLLECREPMVIESMIKRIDCGVTPTIEGNVAWLSVLDRGVYSSGVDDQTGAMLDYMVFKDMVEYEAYDTYTISNKYMEQILKKDEIFMSWLCKYLECDDVVIIERFMERHGFELKGKKFTKCKFEPIGFLL